MRESIGSTWTLQLVIVFILLFVGFLTLSLGYSRSYKVKNEILSIIEKQEGLTQDAVSIINNYLEYNGYSNMGNCDDNTWSGLKNLNYNTLEPSQAGEKYYYCVKKKYSTHSRYYYEVKTFFKFNLPVVGDFATFDIEGTTADVLSFDSYNAYN